MKTPMYAVLWGMDDMKEAWRLGAQEEGSCTISASWT